MKLINFRTLLSVAAIAAVLSGCAQKTGNQTYDQNQNAAIGTMLGALAGVAIGNNVGGGDKGKRKIIGAVAGAAIGGAIGYSMDKQAKEVADSLDTNVNNNPNAALDPSQDLIVSNTDQYVKIMFRDAMMFETNSANPTYSAQTKIAKINDVLAKYPNTLVQIAGHTDNTGSHAYNATLSEKRASNVGNIIYNSGAKNQIFSKGCSFDKPIAPNNSDANRALNRRVEVYLYANQESVVDVCR